MSIINEDELKIIKAIAHAKAIHYSDIAKLTGKSKKTITKYLDHIEEEVRQYGVTLVRKRNVGLYFKGDISKLLAHLDLQRYANATDSKSQRLINLLSRLLLSDKPQTVQDLADSAYVSRSTLEMDLKKVKKLIHRFHAELQINHKGLFIVADEKIRRQLMAELLSMYWGDNTYLGGRKTGMHAKIDIPEEMKDFFDTQTLDKVLLALDQFEKLNNFELSDYEYQSLAVHLVIGIGRIQRGEVLHADHNDPLPIDYNTQMLVDILEHYFAIKIPFDEVQYINIHILASKNGKKLTLVTDSGFDLGHQVQDNEVSEFLKRNLHHFDSVLIENLTLHLIPALKRLSLGLSLRNPYTAETKRFFPLAYNQSVDLGLKIKKDFNVILNDDELAYIALHLEAFIERHGSKIRAVIVCSTGLGTARLLEQRISKYFSNQIIITRVTSLQKLKQSPIDEDLVISTINISIPAVPVVVVPPFLNSGAVQQIDTAVQKIQNICPDPSSFLTLIHRKLILIDDSKKTAKEAIIFIGKKIQEENFGNSGLVEAALAREKMASTAIGFVATPHAPVEYVKKACIAVYVNHFGVEWGNNEVRVVFFLALNKEIQPFIEEIYKYFNEILENQQLLGQLSRATQVNEIIKLLGGGAFGK